ncbi:MAG: hypothetical protein EOP04_03285 [Proteobacteria bacterium]|nr:MAG: hypothetical protein EOP04_03285 [Pseudomonadota bacterium]
MLSRRAKVIAGFIFLALALIVFMLNKKDSQEVASGSSTSLPKTTPGSVKRLAVEPIKLRRVSAPQDGSTTETADNFVMPSDIPSECQDFKMIKDIVESSNEEVIEKIQSPTPELKSCLSVLGAPPQCFSMPAAADEDRTCANNLIIARARLIDSMSASTPIETLDQSVVANKIIAKIYSLDKSMDEMGPEIFTLADKLVQLDKENPEAHNLRSYFTIQAIKKNFDEKVLDKGKESATFLAGSSENKDYSAGLSYQFGYSMIGFIASKDPANLDQAEFYAKEHLAKYPQAPQSYHMMATLEGYRDHLSLCKEWTQKGLDIGGKDQAGYKDYVSIIQSIDAGTFKKEYLGVRVDASQAFAPERILQ